MADDTIPLPGILDMAIAAQLNFDGLIGFNDGTPRSKHHATHFAVSRQFIENELAGEIFHTGYKHCFCDDELTFRAKLAGKFKYCENAKLKHNHPLLDKGIKSDADYERVYSKDYFEHDEKLWKKRKKELLFVPSPKTVSG